MADQSDVEAALVNQAFAALYPNGLASGSVLGADCRIYRGWPNAAALDADLRNGLVNVTVFPAAGAGNVSTRYLQSWNAAPAAPALTVSVAGDCVTFAGSADAGQLAGLRIDQRTYAYRTQPGDTPASVAANLAAQARADMIVQLSFASLTVPGAGTLAARVVADAAAWREVRRQRQSLRLTCWCPTPALRDAAATAIDQCLASLTFLDLADGSQAHIQYAGTLVFDQSQDALLYRRDLLYAVEYATLLSALQPSMLWGEIGIGAAVIPA
jgi:hypothetical protein